MPRNLVNTELKLRNLMKATTKMRDNSAEYMTGAADHQLNMNNIDSFMDIGEEELGPWFKQFTKPLKKLVPGANAGDPSVEHPQSVGISAEVQGKLKQLWQMGDFYKRTGHVELYKEYFSESRMNSFKSEFKAFPKKGDEGAKLKPLHAKASPGEVKKYIPKVYNQLMLTCAVGEKWGSLALFLREEQNPVCPDLDDAHDVPFAAEVNDMFQDFLNYARYDERSSLRSRMTICNEVVRLFTNHSNILSAIDGPVQEHRANDTWKIIETYFDNDQLLEDEWAKRGLSTLPVGA